MKKANALSPKITFVFMGLTKKREATAGRRSKHAKVVLQWGRWLHRLGLDEAGRTTGEALELDAALDTGGVAAVASQMNLYRCDH